MSVLNDIQILSYEPSQAYKTEWSKLCGYIVNDFSIRFHIAYKVAIYINNNKYFYNKKKID